MKEKEEKDIISDESDEDVELDFSNNNSIFQTIDNDDGVPNKKGILQYGFSRGRKDHTEGSPYAEDCFVVDVTEIGSMLDVLDPSRYNVFGYLSSGSARQKGLEFLKSYPVLKKQLEKLIPDFFDQTTLLFDDYLLPSVYKKRIDDWVEKVKNSRSRAVKIVINSHGSDKDILYQVMPRSAKYMQDKKYTGLCTPYKPDALNCLKYLFEKLETIDKNIDIVNNACHAAEYFDIKKTQNILDLITKAAQNIKKTYGKNIIYTCNFSKNCPLQWYPRGLRKYSEYKNGKFVSLNPDFYKDANKKNIKSYEKYQQEKYSASKQLTEKKYKKTQFSFIKTKDDELREIDLRLGSAYLRYIKDTLASYGKSKTEKAFAKRQIEQIEKALKDEKLAKEKIKLLNAIKNCQPIAITVLDVEKTLEKDKNHNQQLIEKYKKENNKEAVEILEECNTNESLAAYRVFLEEKRKTQEEEKQDIKQWSNFLKKHPECLQDYDSSNAVKKYHRRHRSYELFFDDETLKQMKEAKEKKNELLFGEKNEIKEEDKKEEEKNKNEIKEISENTNLNLENKSQINEINGY